MDPAQGIEGNSLLTTALSVSQISFTRFGINDMVCFYVGGEGLSRKRLAQKFLPLFFLTLFHKLTKHRLLFYLIELFIEKEAHYGKHS